MGFYWLYYILNLGTRGKPILGAQGVTTSLPQPTGLTEPLPVPEGVTWPIFP